MPAQRWTVLAAFVLVAAVLAATPSGSCGANTYWQGPPGSAESWFTAANWTAGVPNSDDYAYVDNVGQVTIDSGTAQAGVLHLGYDDSGTLNQCGGTLTISRYYVYLGCNAGSTGRYEMSGGTLRITGSGGTLYVGNYGDGTFVQTGGTVTGGDSALALGFRAGSTGLYLMSSTASLTVASTLVGCYGTGRFEQTGGSHTLFKVLRLGYHLGSSGTYLLGGGTLTAPEIRVGCLEGAGRMTQTDGECTVSGSLYLGGSETCSSGTYELEGGGLTVGALVIGWNGAGVLRQTGGRLTVADRIDNGGVIDLAGGTLVADTLAVGYLADSDGLLGVNGGLLQTRHLLVGTEAGRGRLALLEPTARVEVAADWDVGPYGALTVAPGVEVHMTGSAFLNHSTDNAALADLEYLRLVFEGGDDHESFIEVAGADLGLLPEGFHENFALAALVVGTEECRAIVRLIDDFDNGNRTSPEALYVHDLVVGPGSVLDLNGLKLYYDGTYENLGGQVLGGQPMPEPATLALVALGGLVLLRRRRRASA